MDTKVKLSTLWLFATLNYVYCDVVGLMDAHLLNQYLTGTVGSINLTQGFLLAGSVLVEVPIVMILLSRLLNHKANRVVNIVAGILMTLAQTATLFLGTATIYYLFFSVIEIATTICIVYIAWKWLGTREQYIA